MPRKAKIPCSYKGCRELIESGTGNYCQDHKKVKNSVYNRTRSDKDVVTIYSTPRWKRIRKMALVRDNALCQHCKERNAEVVDHIVEIKDGGDPYDLSNLESLCNRCHAIKTAQAKSERESGGSTY